MFTRGVFVEGFSFLLLIVPHLNAERVKQSGRTEVLQAGHSLVGAQPPGQVLWQSPATKKDLLCRTHGTLAIDTEGIRFKTRKGPMNQWSYLEIKTLDVRPRSLILVSYQGKFLHQPGERSYHFRLRQPMLPRIAAELAQRVRKPVRNGDPDANTASFASIPAHHHLIFGGTNGVLRFTESGIQYITRGGDARSWRWTDISAVSSPDEYRLFVFGYLDSYRFDLKQPMTRVLLNRLTDEVFAHNSLDHEAYGGGHD